MGHITKAIFIILLTLLSVYGDEVDIIIVNSNITIDNQSPGYYNMSMPENNHDYPNTDNLSIPFFVIKNVNVQPSITPATAMFLYEIVEGQTATEYNFNCLQVIDYDTMPKNQKYYAFTFTNFGTQPIVFQINIINIDDEPPTFTPPICTVDEFTIYDAANSSCAGTVSDPDGWLGYMKFEFNQPEFGLEYKVFPDNDTQTSPIYLTVKKELDYQKKPFYSFDVHAEDQVGHPNTLDNVTAVVKVNDLRNNPPTWIKTLPYEAFQEKTSQVFEVLATDGDKGIGATVNYKVGEDKLNFITIDKKTGEITVSPIDRDKYDLTIYEFTLMAYIENEDMWNTTMPCNFYIQDIDDNPPVIKYVTINETNTTTFADDATEKPIFLTFIENYNGDLNTSTFIEDIDQGANSEFSVSLLDVDDAKDKFAEAFMVTPTTGLRNGTFSMVVKDNTNLDFENSTWKAFQFYVLSEGTLDPSHTDKMLVTVQLIDYNDEWPIFDEEEYLFTINETAKKGETIGLVTATDKDAEDQGKLRYQIISTLTTVDIDTSTGELTVAVDKAFDYDKINPIYFQVQVNDTVDHTATVPVTINLLDVNNKAPSISVSNIVNVDENQEKGVKLNVTITASDPDTTGSLTAKIDWDKTTVAKNSKYLDLSNSTIFELVDFLDVTYDPEDARNINIELICKGDNSQGQSPDYEIFDSLYLSLLVNDTNTDPEFLDQQTTSVTVLITLNDLNDNLPYFPDVINNVTVNRTVIENARIDTSVGIITADDLDQLDQGKLVYSCTADNEEYDWVVVDKETGVLTVINNSLVNADIPLWYFNYTCQVQDSDPTHYAEIPLRVEIYILDTNNKKPVITLDQIVYVVEKSNYGEVVVDIGIDDEDREIPFKTSVCRFDYDQVCYSKFQITDNNVIEVKVENGTKDLDRDYGDKSYSCTGTCMDNVRMEQGDRTQNTVPFATTIELLDINDHSPELAMKNVDLVTYENIQKDNNFQEIIAKDPDYKENGTIIFYDLIITDDQEQVVDLFDIVVGDDYHIDDINKRAHFLAKEDLTGYYGAYNVQIFMRDNSSVAPRENNDTVNLEIKRYNFDAPRFVYPKNGDTIILNSIQLPDTPLVQFLDDIVLPDFIVADKTDHDTCQKWKIDMIVADQSLVPAWEQGPDKKFFIIKSLEDCKYQLQVDDNFVDNQNSYSVILKAEIESDREPMAGEALYASNITIQVDFRNKSQQPTFLKTSWEFSLLEDDVTQTQIMDADEQAIYEPAQPTNFIYYSLILPDDAKDYFDIGLTTGTITLKKKLDYLNQIVYNFVIVASNSKEKISDDVKSRKSVTVNVIDINNHPPIFDQHLYYGAIMPTYTSSIAVTVHATDLDTIDNDRLVYTLIGNFTPVGKGLDRLPDPPFQVKNDGQIDLKFTVDSSMSGYIYFNVMVQDHKDDYGNGPFNDTALVYIFIVTSDNIVTFLFQNNRTTVLEQEQRMLEIVGENINNYKAARQDLKASNSDDYSTNAYLFFVDQSTSVTERELLYYSDTEKLSLVKASEVLKVVTSYDKFIKLKTELRNETGLILESFPSPDNTENLEPVLRAWLIGVSVVLGTLCFVLLITFILKIRQLKRTISNLVTNKYGSQESGLNRMGVSLPNANKHAIEGSNPVYSIDRHEKEKDLYDYDDQKSVNSGDSDLIGVEEKPEFDYDFGSKKPDVTTYL